MQPNESDVEPLHPALKRHQERAAAKVHSAKRADRVDMLKVLAEFRDERAKRGGRLNEWWQRRAQVDWFGRFWPRLVLAGGIAAVLFLGLVLFFPSRHRPITIAFAALGRGNQVPAGAYPLAGEFVMELDLPAKRVRFIEGAQSYAGKLVEQKGDLPGVTPFGFEVHGRSSSGTAVVVTGLLKLTGSQPNKLPEAAQEILSAHIAASVQWGSQRTDVDRLFLP
jgi:hypothetical protein